MGFSAAPYENQIRAILQAPGVDLSTISAKRVRKQLVELNDDLTAELAKAHKDELDALIGLVYEQVSAPPNDEYYADGSSSAPPPYEEVAEHEQEEEEEEEAEEHPKRKLEDTDDAAKQQQQQQQRKKAKKERAQRTKTEMTDEELARQLAQELNGRDRPTRAAAAKPAKAKPKPKAKRARKAKSAATVDSDEDGGGEHNNKRRGGFAKEYTLSEPLAALVEAEKMSRPQIVKRIWEHIKEHNLQNPLDKREIICDDKMRSIFNLDKIGMFKMNKLLGDHLYEPPEPAAA